jgi:hypothetical protein
VVVPQPAITLDSNNVNINTDHADPMNPAVAFAGTVELKVSTAQGTITKGDFLTSSDIPGLAVKVTRPGYAVAQALEDYNSVNTGLLKVVLKPGYVDPANDLGGLKDKVSELETQISELDKVQNQGVDAGTKDQVDNLGQKVTDIENNLGITFDTLTKYQTAADLLNSIETTQDINNNNALNLKILTDTTFMGAILIDNDLTVVGQIIVGSDTAGKVTIKENESRIDVKFARVFGATPIVVVSPTGLIGYQYYVTNETPEGFSIELEAPTSVGIIFNYHALGTIPLVTITPTPTP